MEKKDEQIKDEFSQNAKQNESLNAENLSIENLNDEKLKIDPAHLVFHYNRENRISRAPSRVKSAYDGTMKKPPKGFFRALIHTKSSRIMLIVMVLVLGFTVASLLTGGSKSKGRIEDIIFRLSAFSFEDTIYISLQISPDEKMQSKTKSILPKERIIDAIFSFKNAEGESLVQQSLTKTFENNEIFLRTTLSDYDILSVDCVLQIDNQDIMLETRVEKK